MPNDKDRLSAQLPLGLPALFEELQSQELSPQAVCAEAGVPHIAGERAVSNVFPRDLPAILRAAARLSRLPDTAIKAGQRQTISNFGVFGFALLTSSTFAQAFRFGLQHLDLAGAVMHIDFRRENGVGILQTRNPMALGGNLQFVAEYWRSSMTALLSDVLGRPFPSLAMYFPYRRPDHFKAYHRVFNCELHFGADTMQWHFDARVLDETCPKADALTSRVCQDFCERIVSSSRESQLQRAVQNICMVQGMGAKVTAHSVAAMIGMSDRSLHRHLAQEGTSFKRLLDNTRFSVAAEYLQTTGLSVDEIAVRCGYGDVSNFRKAFRRWSNLSPSDYRSAALPASRQMRLRMDT